MRRAELPAPRLAAQREPQLREPHAEVRENQVLLAALELLGEVDVIQQAHGARCSHMRGLFLALNLRKGAVRLDGKPRAAANGGDAR